MLKGRTPLGWLQLTQSKARFVVAASGVGFAVVLVFMQLGFMNMLFDATTVIHKQFATDLVMMSADAEGIVPDSGSFSRRRLVQAAGVPGVADFAEVYIQTLTWTKPSDVSVGQIVVFAVPTDTRVFVNPELDAQMAKLRVPGTFLLDLGSRGDFTDFFSRIDAGEAPTTKLSGQTMTPSAPSVSAQASVPKPSRSCRAKPCCRSCPRSIRASSTWALSGWSRAAMARPSPVPWLPTCGRTRSRSGPCRTSSS